MTLQDHPIYQPKQARRNPRHDSIRDHHEPAADPTN
ncbi:unnamed protein product [Brassica rapa subsp. trilocularis]